MADYGIPPWIQPPDTARQYATGLQLGINIAQHQQRLQAQQEQAAMEAQVRAKQLEQETAFQQQKIQMDQAYKDQMIGVQKSRLEEAARKNALVTKAAAAKFAAQEQFRRRVAGGEDPAKAMLELGPSMAASAGDFGAALRSAKGPTKAVWVPKDLQGAPGHFLQPSGAALVPRSISDQGEMSASLRGQTISYWKSKRAQLVKDMPPAARTAETRAKRDAERKPFLDQIAEIDAKIEDLLKPPAKSTAAGGVRKLRRNERTGKLEFAQ